MKDYKIAILDDEQVVHERIKSYLTDYSNESGQVFSICSFFSGKEFIEKAFDYDAVMLDIEMPDADGIEVGNRLRKIKWNGYIIMLTGVVSRFKETYKIGAFRFITKPIQKKEVYETMDELFEQMIGYGLIDVIATDVHVTVSEKDIKYIESHGDYLKIYTEKDIFTKNISLKGMKELVDERLFLCPGQSYLVNMYYINHMGDRELELEDGTVIKLSKRKKSDARFKYMQYRTRTNRWS